MKRLGVETKKIAGRRITDDETLEAAKMVFAGLSTDILSLLRRHKTPAVGLSGVDGDLVLARKRPKRMVRDPETGCDVEVDFQNVGDIVSINPRVLEVLLANHFVPVVACLGADDEETCSISMPTRWRARSPGAWPPRSSSPFPTSTRPARCERSGKPDLVPDGVGARAAAERGTIKGGMLPKVETSIEAVWAAWAARTSSTAFTRTR